MLLNIPTSKDIFIEINGEKVAIVDSYKAKTVRETAQIKEFGNPNPVCSLHGNISHTLELRRVYFVANSVTEIDFHALTNFTVVIVKPNKRVLYTGCEWGSINEGVSIDEPCIETMTVTSARRLVI